MANPTIEQARAFCEVADTHSYVEAAKRLGHSRMSVIRLIDRFAQSVGRSDLFGASRRGKVDLTAAGRELLLPAQRFLEAADALTGSQAEIRFSAYPSIVQQVLAKAPELLGGQKPLLLDDVSEERRGDGGEGLVSAVAIGRLDLAAAPSDLLGLDAPGSGRLEELPLYDWKLRVVVSEDHPYRGELAISPLQLSELEISAAPHGHHSRFLLDAAFSAAGVPLRVALESSSQHTLRALGEAGNRYAAVIPDDAFGAPNEKLGPCLTDGSGREMGGSYSLYLRVPEQSEGSGAVRELAVREVAEVIQGKLTVLAPS